MKTRSKNLLLLAALLTATLGGVIPSQASIVQEAYIKASNTESNDLFGYRVAVSGDTMVVGVPYEDSNASGVNGDQSNNSAGDSGAAYVFVRNGTTWSQQAYVKASNTGAGDAFGVSVGVSSDTMVIGRGVNGNAGAAYLFVRSGTTWSQRGYLKASNTRLGDYGFGFSVAISGDTVVVGAIGESSNATGVNGNQSDNSAPGSGAAYVFTLAARLSINPDGNSGYLICVEGIPDCTYQLQRAPSLSGPWDILDTQTAPVSGLIQYDDTNPLSGAAFYRTSKP